jgi:ABC-type antimicrobial peptide transport system permease subunit
MSVARRLREIGVRMALGAGQRRLVGMIVLEHLRPSLAGVVLGLIGSWWAVQLLRGYLYEVDVHEPGVWLAATATLVLAATAGAWLPARRASRVGPVIVLRAE